MRTPVLCAVLLISASQALAFPCVHDMIQQIEKEKNLIGDIAEAREALRDFRISISDLGKQVTSSIMVVSKESLVEVKAMIEKLKGQGLTAEEEAHLKALVGQAKSNINDIVKVNMQDLKNIRMAVAEIIDDLIYDHSQLQADVQKFNEARKQFQENVVASTKSVAAELKIVHDALSVIMNVHANEMAMTISESVETIRQTMLKEYQLVKNELVEVKVAETHAVEAVKKVLSHFNPAAHVTEKPLVTEVYGNIL